MLPFHSPASLRTRNAIAMTGPAMPIWMPKEPTTNLMLMAGVDRQEVQSKGRHSYRVIEEWTTKPNAWMEDAKIKHEIYTKMKKFMHVSGLKKTPEHKPKETDINLWKQYSKEYFNKMAIEWPDHSDVLCIIALDVKRR